MAKQQDFLVEIGSEELPPKALLKLAQTFEQSIIEQFNKLELHFSASQFFATPRRLAVVIKGVDTLIPGGEVERKGPSKKAAFDDNGQPTQAALGFARSCGADIKNAEIRETDKGEWLYIKQTIPDQNTIDLLADIVNKAIKQLPIPRPMRWSNFDTEFARPVHWIVMLFGDNVIDTTILGKKASNQTRGHRFHHPEAITITAPENYSEQLKKEGMVIADFNQRRDEIRHQIESTAKKLGKARIDDDLLEEVTAIVEWPVALMGHFDERFLVVPHEALITAMQQHQRCFPMVDNDNKLLPNFITVCNIASKNPQEVIIGNERVIRARLSDAEFFFQTDIKHKLDHYADKLSSVIFQNKLGTLRDKTYRIKNLSSTIAKEIGGDCLMTERAAELSKADLMSEMVGEFPELQGIMGYYYALRTGDGEEVAAAIKEHYQPRFSGDALPSSKTSCALAIADKIDTLIGIIGINQTPTGEKDPFALRRAALGILRIIIEKQLPLDLATLFEQAKELYPKLDNPDVVSQSLDFVLDRLRTWYSNRNISAEVFNAVHARYPTKPLDFDLRINAVQHFQSLPEAKALAAANKRVSNILKKSGDSKILPVINMELLQDPAEQDLATLISQKDAELRSLSKSTDYTNALSSLAELQQPVDKFFDDVMVMTDDKSIRENRLALLNQLRQLFLQIADISHLSN